jgi:hypothetical protein
MLRVNTNAEAGAWDISSRYRGGGWATDLAQKLAYPAEEMTPWFQFSRLATGSFFVASWS